MADDDMLNISAAAKEFDIPRLKLYRWIKSGRLSAFRSGRDERERLVRRSDVQALLGPTPIEIGEGPADLKSAA